MSKLNVEVVAEIIDIAEAIKTGIEKNDNLTDDDVKFMLRDIVDYGLELYEDHTGEPLYPQLVKAEDLQ